jgi:hypothetical protein
MPSIARLPAHSAPPSHHALYSVDLAGFIKYVDKIAAVVVNSPMLARRLHHSPRRNSFPCIALRTLDLSLRSFSNSRPLFSTTSALFLQNTRVAYLPVSTLTSAPFRLRRHMRHVAPLSPVASVDCAYFPSPQGCTERPPNLVSPLVTRHFRPRNKREMYSRIWRFQYGQSCPPCGPQLSREWRMPLLARISQSRYDGLEFSHGPVPLPCGCRFAQDS